MKYCKVPFCDPTEASTEPTHRPGETIMLLDSSKHHLTTFPDVDCDVSSWKPWGVCSERCGGRGTQTTTRMVVTPRQGSNCTSRCCQLYLSHSGFDRQGKGKVCPLLTAVRHCNPQACPTGSNIAIGLWIGNMHSLADYNVLTLVLVFTENSRLWSGVHH